MIQEPSSFGLPISKGLALLALMALYFLGVWLRTYVLPSGNVMPFKRQLAAAIPVGFITMGAYSKAALPPLFAATTDVTGDIAIMIGYTIVFGMMSREALEKLLTAPLPGIGGGGAAGGSH